MCYLVSTRSQPGLSVYLSVCLSVYLSIIYLSIYLSIYLWLCWVFVSVRGFSLVAASGGHSSSQCVGLSLSQPLVAEHRLQTRRLSNCGPRAQPLHGMWDLPRPGLEPVSPALAGRLSTTAPPGKPCFTFFFSSCFLSIHEHPFLIIIHNIFHPVIELIYVLIIKQP